MELFEQFIPEASQAHKYYLFNLSQTETTRLATRYQTIIGDKTQHNIDNTVVAEKGKQQTCGRVRISSNSDFL